jgi:hypothetical protein
LNGDTNFGRYFNYFGIRVLIWCEWDATETHTLFATVHFKTIKEGDEILQNLPQITPGIEKPNFRHIGEPLVMASGGPY